MFSALFNISVYVAFAFFASFLALKSYEDVENNHFSNNKWDKYLIYYIIFFVLIAAFRCAVGSDHISYAYKFATGRVSSTGKELLFNQYVIYAHKLGVYWVFSMGLCAYIQFYFLTKPLLQYRWLLVFVPFVLFGGRYWSDMMGAIRQMMVVCAFFWATKFIYKKQLIYYLAFVFVGSLVHKSAVLLLPFYFIPKNLSLERHRIWLLVILLACVVLGQSPNFSSFGSYVKMIAETSDYDEKADQLSNMLAGESGEVLNFGPTMLSFLLIPIFIIWYGPQMRARFKEVIPMFDIWYNFAYLYACMYFLVCQLGHYYIRPTMYFELHQMVMGALLLYFLYSKYKVQTINPLKYFAYCAVVALGSVTTVYRESQVEVEMTSYKILYLSDYSRHFAPIL